MNRIFDSSINILQIPLIYFFFYGENSEREIDGIWR